MLKYMTQELNITQAIHCGLWLYFIAFTFGGV
jgi:hypothetical protein